MINWEHYYQENDHAQIPWSGNGEKMFRSILPTLNLPKQSNVLDVGCGRGDKTMFLANEGFRAWGFDVSPTAIMHAKEASKDLPNPPVFFTANAGSLGTASELQGITFDLIIDLFSTQFLSTQEKLDYLSGLSKTIKPNQTFYLLACVSKNYSDEKLETAEAWIQEVAQSSEDVKAIYGKIFSIVSEKRKLDPRDEKRLYMF